MSRVFIEGYLARRPPRLFRYVCSWPKAAMFAIPTCPLLGRITHIKVRGRHDRFEPLRTLPNVRQWFVKASLIWLLVRRSLFFV